MCEVTFTLRHYSISGHKKPDGRVVEANDTFSAQVEAVVILKKPPTIARSPYKGRLAKRPHHQPQHPSRGEQVNAAAGFVRQPNFTPPIAGKPTAASLVDITARFRPAGTIPASADAASAEVDDPFSSTGHPQASQISVASATPVNPIAISEVPIAVGIVSESTEARAGSIQPRGKITSLSEYSDTHINAMHLTQVQYHRSIH